MVVFHSSHARALVRVLLLAVLVVVLSAYEFAMPRTAQLQGHALWTAELKQYVSAKGTVNYARWKQALAPLKRYLGWLKDHAPAVNAPEAEQLAYWINAYNAYTVDLVLRHYPLRSIRDMKLPEASDPWSAAFIPRPGGGKNMTLNEIEHELLRKRFKEPRIHFALVCAARSCPPLRAEAYLAHALEAQLEDQARRFLRDASKNRLQGNTLQLSALFDWFADDFRAQSVSIVDYVRPYLLESVPKEVRTTYLPYDWSLNEGQH